MKISAIVSLLFLLALVACTPTKEEVCSKIDEAVRSNIEEIAETYQLSLEIAEVHTVDYDTINENQLDRIRLSGSHNRYERFWNEYQTQKAGIEATLDQLEADQKKGQSPSPARKKEVETSAQRMIVLYDSVKHYLTLDSTIKARILARQDTSKIYFYSKTYNRYRLAGRNTADTSRYIVDQKFKIVRLSN